MYIESKYAVYLDKQQKDIQTYQKSNALKIPAFESRMHAMVDELEKRTDDVVISEIVRRGKAKINALSTGRKNEGKRASVSEILTGIKKPSMSSSDFNTDDITVANEAFERVSIAPVPKSAVNERRVYAQKEANESRSVNEAYLRISELEMELEASQQKVDEMTQKFESARDGMNFYKRDNESLRNGIAKSIRHSILKSILNLLVRLKALHGNSTMCRNAPNVLYVASIT